VSRYRFNRSSAAHMSSRTQPLSHDSVPPLFDAAITPHLGRSVLVRFDVPQPTARASAPRHQRQAPRRIEVR
jgi:hypothetical protein